MAKRHRKGIRKMSRKATRHARSRKVRAKEALGMEKRVGRKSHRGHKRGAKRGRKR